MDKLVNPHQYPVQLIQQAWKQMLESVISLDPVEACGLLLGIDRLVSTVIPVTNVLHSTTRYKMDHQEQLSAFNYIEENELNLLGIYHSHPNGPDSPSQTDIAEAYYPEAAQLIWYKQNHHWSCRAYYIKSGTVTEAELIIIP